MGSRLVQRLLAPGSVSLGIVALSNFGKAAKDLFVFDDMGASEFEHGSLNDSMNRFYEYAKNGQIVDMIADFEEGGKIYRIRALVPMTRKHLEDASLFVQDQMSSNPQESCLKSTLMRESVLLGTRACIGWQDATNDIFYFTEEKGEEAFNLIKATFHLYANPCVDQNLTYLAWAGGHKSDVIKNMQRLANTLQQEIICPDFNGREIRVQAAAVQTFPPSLNPPSL
ncbi:MAG: hypothetical protein ACT4OY_03520 [Alphaproteobacteria bacterium]